MEDHFLFQRLLALFVAFLSILVLKNKKRSQQQQTEVFKSSQVAKEYQNDIDVCASTRNVAHVDRVFF